MARRRRKERPDQLPQRTICFLAQAATATTDATRPTPPITKQPAVAEAEPSDSDSGAGDDGVDNGDDRLVRAFLDGAGPAAIGAILGVAIPLAHALSEPWQYLVLAGAALLIFLLRRGVVLTLVLAGAAGAIVALTGGQLPR